MIALKRSLLAAGGVLLCLPCSGWGPPILRMRFMAVFQTQHVPSKPKLTLVSKRINERPPHTGFQYKLLDEKNRVFEQGFVKTFDQKEILLSGCPTPTCLLQAELPHGCQVQTYTPYAYVASKENFLRLKESGGKLYFYVPEDCEEVSILAMAGSPGEGASLRIIDPDGNVAASVGGELQSWKEGRLTVRPKALDRGCAWMLQVRSHPGLLLDDVYVAVEGNAPPLLAVKPHWVELIGSQMMKWSESTGNTPPKQEGGKK